MSSNTTEVPKKRKDQLNDLEIGEFFPIETDKRQAWANFISSIHGMTDKRWSIKENNGEIRVWRLN